MAHQLNYKTPEIITARRRQWFGWISLGCALATYFFLGAAYHRAGLFRDRYVALLLALPVGGFASGIIGVCWGRKSWALFAGLILNSITLLLVGAIVMLAWLIGPINPG
jgi:hypothetical protein